MRRSPDPRRHVLAPLLAALLLLASLSGCGSLPQVEQPASHAIGRSDTDLLGRIARASLPAGSTSGFRPLEISAFSLDARLALIAHAHTSIDVQYYLIQDDRTGHLFMRALRDAAARGVRVRLLVDDLYTAASAPTLRAFDAMDRVEVRVYNPFAWGRSSQTTRLMAGIFSFSRMNHRMHNKLLIVDGAFAIAGGRNIGDEYFFRSQSSNFIDFDLMVSGAAVDDLGKSFDRYWNSRWVFELTSLGEHLPSADDARQQFEAATRDATPAEDPKPGARDDRGALPVSVEFQSQSTSMFPAKIEVFADDPAKADGRALDGNDPDTVIARALELMQKAQSSLLLVSPYFVPGDNGLAAIEQACARGVAMTLVTNAVASNDNTVVSGAYSRERKKLLRDGVEIYEISSEKLHENERVGELFKSSSGSSHAKLAVVDKQWVLAGSMNFDLRSSRQNTELGLLVESKDFAERSWLAVENLEQSGSYRLRLTGEDQHIEWVTRREGVEYRETAEPEMTFRKRLQLWLSPLVPESLL